jgi:hypothetical protein
MSRILVLGVLVALLASTASAATPASKDKPDPSASSSAGHAQTALCKQQLKTMGADRFRATYAPNGSGENAFGKCVSQHAQKDEDGGKNPAKTCKAERASLGVDAFGKKYGTNHNLRNAFGKCVSGKSKDDTKADQDEDALGADKPCKKERAELGDEAFKSKYGRNHNKANAFGKCVSSKSKEHEEPDDD